MERKSLLRTYFGHVLRLELPVMNRIFGLFLLATAALASGAWAQTAAQSQGKAERRDAIFLRFPEMAQRYWENSETNAGRGSICQ